ncbi:MAG: IS110 family transposase [Verrucomicrobiota bacterium]
MTELSVIGIDLAKRVFQVCGLDEAGRVVVQRRLGRAGFMRFMEKQPRTCLVGFEACGGAHFWGRWLMARGFTVKMMSPQAVRPYAAGAHKNDPRDAYAVAEATTRAHVAAVAIKSEAGQGLQALVRVRARRVDQLVRATNQLRALLHEFGFVVAKGRRRLLITFEDISGSEVFAALPEEVREMFADLHAECLVLTDQVETATTQLKAATATHEICRLVMSIPHLGPINAASLAAVEALEGFRNGRAFTAYLGLVPRQHASGETNHLRGITKHGAGEIRRYLVLAAQTFLIRAHREHAAGRRLDRLQQWALALSRRKPHNVAVTAIAARLARIAWAVMRHRTPYQGHATT